MKPILCIPTYNRPNGIAIERCKNLPMDKYLFIRKEQYNIYKSWEQQGYNLITIPKDIQELGRTRRYIVYWCSKKSIDWAFMFDDDIRKVELLGQKEDGTYNSKRIIDGQVSIPRFEHRALKLWYNLARKYELSLSSPNHRAYDRFNHGPNIRVNKSAVIQCFLMHIPDIVSVGNFRDTRVYGAEDYDMMYRLMSNGYKTGKIGLVEFDAASIGNISDGTNDEFYKKYQRFVSCFKEKVCNDPELIGVKTTSTGVPSIQFKWKNWGGYDITLEECYE